MGYDWGEKRMGGRHILNTLNHWKRLIRIEARLGFPLKRAPIDLENLHAQP